MKIEMNNILTIEKDGKKISLNMDEINQLKTEIEKITKKETQYIPLLYPIKEPYIYEKWKTPWSNPWITYKNPGSIGDVL